MNSDLELRFRKIIMNTDLIKYLRVMKETGIPENSWLVAGAIRNTVWKYLFPDSELEVNDIDIIHYSPDLPIAMNDVFIERLVKNYPQGKWDCANQFHIYSQKSHKYNMPNGPYLSIEHSMKDFWFTVNTIAIRLSQDDKIEIMNPEALEDLFNGILQIMKFQKDNNQNWFLDKIEKITSRCVQIKVVQDI